MNRDKIYLQHILQSIQKIQRYINHKDFVDLQGDEILTDALARQLGIIGEAANCFGNEFRDKYPEILYREMIGMRNFLVHEYAKVDKMTVWNTCKEDLPLVQKQLQEILHKC